MMEVCHRKNCTGCGLCASLCPQKCISMEEGLLGHLYPVVDESKCIRCDACRKKCPSLNKIQGQNPFKCFAAWAKDWNEYVSSTSGGVAAVASRKIITDGGVVYGCATHSGVDVKHIRVESEEDLPKLKGSKYVQSSIREVFPLIRKDIMEKRRVLFIGTPCQVAAVKSLFREQPAELFLIDIVCHGVPSLSFLKKHISKFTDLKKVTQVLFRDGFGYKLQVFVGDKCVYAMPLWERRYKDTYFNSFMDGYTCRSSCNECFYANPQRISDITICDFWGLGKKISDESIPDHPNGISAVLLNTKKGEAFMEQIGTDMFLYERPVMEAVEGNDQLKFPKKETHRIKFFKKIYKLLGVSLAYRCVELDHIIRYKVRKVKKIIKDGIL